MSEVIEAARAVCAEDHQRPVIRFSVCMIPGRSGMTKGWRWVTTDCHLVVKFFLACWNNREAIAAGKIGHE